MTEVERFAAGLDPLLRRTLGEHVNIVLELDPGVWPAEVDQAQLEACLVNLATNARDAMPDGGSIIVAAREEIVKPRSRSKLKAGRYVRLSVKDTGEGMDKATLRRAMEPFFTTKEPGKGTGLGLALVHGIIGEHGGKIQLMDKADYDQGRGVIVQITLPAWSEPEEDNGA